MRTFEKKGGGHPKNWKKGFEPKIFYGRKTLKKWKQKNVTVGTEDRTHDPSDTKPACCHGSIRITLNRHDERQNQYLVLTIRIASS